MVVCDAVVCCSICLQDIHPAKEELLTMKTCGHVLHKGCLETWLKRSARCPICNRSARDVIRLYFQKRDAEEGDDLPPKELVAKLSQLYSDLEEMKKELSSCKEEAQREKEQKEEALNREEDLRLKLEKRVEELENYTLDYPQLQELNSALKKEVAALEKTLWLRSSANRELFIEKRLLERKEAEHLRSIEGYKETIRKLRQELRSRQAAAGADAREQEHWKGENNHDEK